MNADIYEFQSNKRGLINTENIKKQNLITHI